MHPGEVAAQTPDKPAYIMHDSGMRVTYAELEATANQGAHLFRVHGLKRGDHIAILLENHLRFFQIAWAAQRAGLYYTTISWRLQQEEVKYIVKDCGAKLLVTSKPRQEIVAPLVDELAGVTRYMLDGSIDGFESWEDAIAAQPTHMIDDAAEGAVMLYSSGTTGYPKGIKHALPQIEYGAIEDNTAALLWGLTDESIYLSPAPLYHAAPLSFCMGALRFGTTVVVMEHFHEEAALKAIQQHQVTHSQWVPTMFVRMLKLPEETRANYDVSSLRCAIHAAAPCPVPVKEQMIEWWGPVIYEYYAGTEGIGFTHADSEQWLAHKGTVGMPIGCEVHICDDDGEEMPVGKSGTIFFSGGGKFEYYKDPEKTMEAGHPKGWSTMGDVGYLDEDGFLYLTDRKQFTIISGGVNIYPQEAENTLIIHDDVIDVAVFGIPNSDLGEEVKAVVQPRDMELAGPELEVRLLDFCRDRLSHIKCPRSIDFRAQLPRHPTGKLYTRLLKDEYWKDQ